jgi:hypothetical protein
MNNNEPLRISEPNYVSLLRACTEILYYFTGTGTISLMAANEKATISLHNLLMGFRIFITKCIQESREDYTILNISKPLIVKKSDGMGSVYIVLSIKIGKYIIVLTIDKPMDKPEIIVDIEFKDQELYAIEPFSNLPEYEIPSNASLKDLIKYLKGFAEHLRTVYKVI